MIENKLSTMISSSKLLDIKFENGKTFISGLSIYIEGADIKQFIKKIETELKKKMIKRTNGEEIETGFEGDCRNEIKNLIKENLNIDDSLISVKEDEKNGEKESDNTLNIINKKISLHHIKEKRTCRTYITGLKDFLNEEELDKTKKELQKALGTNSNMNEQGDYGFNGDYTKDNTKKIIIKNSILKCNKLKIQPNLFDF